jgi:hypothetical protein
LDSLYNLRLDGTELARNIASKNPVLKRSDMIRNSSGKYCLQVPVPANKIQVSKLPSVTVETIDAVLSDPAHQGRIVCICCLADWSKNSHAVQQMLELLRGEEVHNNNNSATKKASNFVLYGWDLSRSRYMINRFNMRSCPALLMFYDARLVFARVLRGKVGNVPKQVPRMLLFDKSFERQRRLEHSMRLRKYHWDLTLNTQTVSRFRKHNYSVFAVDMDLPEQEIKQIYDMIQCPLATGRAFVIGFFFDTQRAADNSTISPVSVAMPPPVRQLDFIRQLERIFDSCRPLLQDARHVGLSRKGVRAMLDDAYTKAKNNQFLPPSFKFT